MLNQLQFVYEHFLYFLILLVHNFSIVTIVQIIFVMKCLPFVCISKMDVKTMRIVI